nr:LuxR C-terminal-related transcriptional regulator [Streptomyces sp. SAI-144]
MRLTRSGTATQALCRPCARPGGLSLREVQVLAELTRGRTNREIAGNLSIAVRTVRHAHRAHLRQTGPSQSRRSSRPSGRLGA